MGALAAAGGLAFSFVFNKAHNDKNHNSGKQMSCGGVLLLLMLFSAVSIP